VTFVLGMLMSCSWAWDTPHILRETVLCVSAPVQGNRKTGNEGVPGVLQHARHVVAWRRRCTLDGTPRAMRKDKRKGKAVSMEERALHFSYAPHA